ncbi:hypothetical protein KUIN1_03340 [Pseudomonas sp. KUIN-1]|nr:hypothetical protein KUIN1_03340 [Pseudomonas sp. KUIN-1]
MDFEALSRIEDGDQDNRASFKIHFIMSRVASIFNSLINGLQRAKYLHPTPFPVKKNQGIGSGILSTTNDRIHPYEGLSSKVRIE